MSSTVFTVIFAWFRLIEPSSFKTMSPLDRETVIVELALRYVIFPVTKIIFKSIVHIYYNPYLDSLLPSASFKSHMLILISSSKIIMYVVTCDSQFCLLPICPISSVFSSRDNEEGALATIYVERVKEECGHDAEVGHVLCQSLRCARDFEKHKNILMNL